MEIYREKAQTDVEVFVACNTGSIGDEPWNLVMTNRSPRNPSCRRFFYSLVMRISQAQLISVARWIFLAASLAALGMYFLVFIFMGNYTVDAMFRPVCPEGWWHTSSSWAHCAFPLVSIAKYASVFTAIFSAALLLAFLLAPRFKKQCCSVLIGIFVVTPIVWQLFRGVSWSASASLVGVTVVSYLLFVWRLRPA